MRRVIAESRRRQPHRAGSRGVAPTHAEPRRGWSTAPAERRRPHRRLLLALAILPLLGGLFVATPPAHVAGDELTDAIAAQKALQAQIKKQRDQIKAIDASQASVSRQITSTKSELAAANADLSVVATRVDALSDTITVSRGQLNLLEAQVDQLDVRLAVVAAREAEKADALAARKSLLAERIRDAYDTDRTPLLETFLSGANFTDILVEVGYELDVAEQDRLLAMDIARDQEVLAALHAIVEETRTQAETLRAATAGRQHELDGQMAELRDAQAQLKDLKARTAAALAQQQRLYADLAANEEKVRAAIAAAEKAEEQLQAKIEELARQQANKGGIPSEYSGSLEWPMAGLITQPFGCTGFSWEPPLGKCRHFHKGIDIAAPMYTPIRASGPGVVLFAGPNPYDRRPKAWIVVIAHSERLFTWYAHIDNGPHPPTVRAGDHVVSGQIIAYEGMTGRTTGPHLHWAVQLDRSFVNPRLFL